jgi:pimeloyl-ACP methyl ester carboxylesterase
LLLHGSAGTGAIWRGMIRDLQPLYWAVAPDLIGYGKSAAWPPHVPFDLEAERRALEALLPCCDKFHVVGYSYGGAVALQLALANPARVRTLTLIEPVFLAALRYAGEQAAHERLCRVRDDFTAQLSSDRAAAMRQFLDFWTGEGAWEKLSPAVQTDMVKIADKIVLDWKAAFAADPGPRRLAPLAARTLLVRGDRSPAPMLRLVDALHRLMPASARMVVPGANHLMPLTHAAALTDAIMARLHADAERRLR